MRTLQKQNLETKGLVEIRDIAEMRRILLDRRGYADLLDSRVFWNPTLDDLHDPFLFPQMEEAVARVLLARDNKERVVIFGDYDVDGVSSTALLLRFFLMLGIPVSYRIPHRVTDGYGMKPYFFDELAEKQVKLVISVDCGTRDIAAIRHAKSLGIDVIITDHHAVPEFVPEEAVALITPKLRDTPYPFHGLSGSGTAFKLLSAVALRIYGDTPKYREILTSFIDFASLGTVADMMPLTGENRTIVKLGLKQMPYSRSPGLRKLIVGKSLASADVIGFHIGPRINAAGRISSAEIALKSLICSEIQVDALLTEIEALNEERKGSTQHFLQLALDTVDPLPTPIFFVSDEIHHGIMGLVAGRLAEHFGKPAIACVRHEGKYMGSARSPGEYHITQALDRMADCFVAFGGHAQAAGFTVLESRFPEFRKRITADAEQVLGRNSGK
jgi:single-stranded-DNA-specific exonuclease